MSMNYDSHGYREDGVLFLLAMAEREWYISTSGTVIYALTDYGIQQLGDTVVPCLAEEYWYTGFYYFLDGLSPYLDAYESGSPVDGYADYSGDYYHGEQEEVIYYEESSPNFVYSLLAGFAVAGIAVSVMRSSMNTKRSQCRGIYDGKLLESVSAQRPVPLQQCNKNTPSGKQFRRKQQRWRQFCPSSLQRQTSWRWRR